MKYTVLILTCALIFNTFSCRLYAEIAPIRVTDSMPTVTGNSHLSIHGMYLVWQAKGGLVGTTSPINDWEIFAYDLATGTVSQITDDTFDDILPRTDGSYIVWQKHVTGVGNQIFLYQANGSDPAGGIRISTVDNGDHFSPDIADGTVVWSRQQIEQSFSPREILLYNAQTRTGPIVISNPTESCSSPHIAANLIVFQQEDADGIETLYLYNVADENPSAKPAPENFTWHTSQQVDGEQTVLSRFSGTDREIFLHSRTDGYIQITDNDLSDLIPVINQNHIAWVAGEEIYAADIASFIRVPVTDTPNCWPTGFLASWSELSGGVDAYYLDVSTNADFQSFVDGFKALNVGNATQYSINGLIPGTTYYYRVYAVINGSTTAYSQSISAALPLSLPTRILSGPPTFIYGLLLK